MKKAITYLGVSLAVSYFSAIVYVIVFTLNLPSSDMAHGTAPFENPLVFLVMSIMALFVGFVGWPAFAFFGRRSRPFNVAMHTGLISVVAILIVTPFNITLGLYAAIVAALITLIYLGRRDCENVAEQGSGANPRSLSE